MRGIQTHRSQQNHERKGKKFQSSPINEFSLEGVVQREGERGQIKNESESGGGRTTHSFSLSLPFSSPTFSLSPPSPLPCLSLLMQAEQFLINTSVFSLSLRQLLPCLSLLKFCCMLSLMISYCHRDAASCNKLLLF